MSSVRTPVPRVGGIFRKIRVHVIPGLRAVDEDVRFGLKEARIVEGADPDTDQIRPGGDSQKQHAAAVRAEGAGHLIATVRRLNVKLWLPLGDPEPCCGNPQCCRVGAAALALTVPAMTEQCKDRFTPGFVLNGAAQASPGHWRCHREPPSRHDLSSQIVSSLTTS